MKTGQVLVLSSGREGPSELLLLKPIVESLKRDGYHVEYFAPDDFSLPLDIPRITWRSAVEFPGLRWLHRTFYFPVMVLRHCLSRKYEAVLACDPYLLFVTALASILIVAKRVLLLPNVPWQRRERLRRMTVTRHLLGFQDFLGMLSASYIVVPTAAARGEIGQVASVIEDKVVELPLAASAFLPEERLEEHDWREARVEVLERYDLPEKITLFGAYISNLPFERVEYCLRLFAVICNHKRALYFLGVHRELNSLMAITVGLGLSDQVFFVETPDELRQVAQQVNIFLLLDENDTGSYALNLARLHGALLIPIGCSHLELIPEEYRFNRGVALDAEVLEEFLSDKSQRIESRAAQQASANWRLEDWGRAARKKVGLFAS